MFDDTGNEGFVFLFGILFIQNAVPFITEARTTKNVRYVKTVLGIIRILPFPYDGSGNEIVRMIDGIYLERPTNVTSRHIDVARINYCDAIVRVPNFFG